jgi:uncharacterized protein YndB with AHSA1/START domain
MELGTIERQIEIDAAPATVFEVITSPEHLVHWWPDGAEFEPVPGAVGVLVFGDRAAGDAQVPQITILEVEPDHHFSFRWTHPAGEAAAAGNSLLVTFELTARDGGTSLRMTETGFRELGWEAAVLEEQYRDHERGWDHFLAQLADYARRVAVTS